MFEAFYEFTATPFSRTIPADKLYRDQNADELIERLKYAAKRQLFAVMVGDSGTGKTTTLRRFCDELRGSKLRTLYMSDSSLTPRLFYKVLLEQLGFEAKYNRNDAKRQLHKEIEIMKGVDGVSPVAIVDEAHLLSRGMLEEIRFLLNFRMDSESPLALVLCGQSELWDKMRLQSYAAIRQRIDIQCVVGHMDKGQAAAYIAAQMAYAGATRDIFTDAAVETVFKFSGGIPRVINKVCTSSLIYGAQTCRNIIDDHMMKLVIETENEMNGGAV